MDFRKLANLQSNIAKVSDSADIEDKDLFDDIVKRYTGQKNLKLLKNPANGESLEKALKDFYKDKKVDCALDGDKVSFQKIKDSGVDYMEEPTEELRGLVDKMQDWIDNGDGIYDLFDEKGMIVYGESDVEESHADDVKKYMEEIGYEEVDTDNHHDTWYQYFKKKVKDDSETNFEEVLSGYGMGDEIDYDDITEELKPLYESTNKWMDKGHADGYAFWKVDEYPVFSELEPSKSHKSAAIQAFKKAGYEYVKTVEGTGKAEGRVYHIFEKKRIKDDSGEEQYDRGVKAGRSALEKGWTKEQTLKYYAELHKQFDEGLEKGFSEVKDFLDGSVEDYIDNFIARPLEDGMEIDLSDFEGLYDEESVREYIEEKSEGKFTIEKIEEEKAIVRKKSEESDLEKAKDYFHNDWFETEEILDFDLTDNEVEELIGYVEELLDNDEDYEGDYPVIKKVDDKIHVYFD